MDDKVGFLYFKKVLRFRRRRSWTPSWLLLGLLGFLFYKKVLRFRRRRPWTPSWLLLGLVRFHRRAELETTLPES